MSERDLGEAERELSAVVGRRGPEQRGSVERLAVERYALASGEDSPIYRDPAAARGAGYADIPSPPTMLAAIIEWGAGPALAELRDDGTGVGKEGWLPLDGLRLMGGGQDLALHRPVTIGTEFVATPELAAVELKRGGAGDLLLLEIATEFREPNGEPLVSCRETLIAR